MNPRDIEGSSNATCPNEVNEENFNSYGITAGEVIALTVISSGISVIGTVSNVLVILAVLLNRQLRQTCTDILLTNLSLSDLIICTVYVPMYIYDVNYGSGDRFEDGILPVYSVPKRRVFCYFG